MENVRNHRGFKLISAEGRRIIKSQNQTITQQKFY